MKDSGFHRSIPVCSSGQSARATSLQAWLRNSCASERPWRSRLGQRPITRSISLEGIGFVLRLSPHRELSHDDATAVAHATPNVRFQVRRLRPSEMSSAPLAPLRLTVDHRVQATGFQPVSFRATLNKSFAGRASSVWAVRGVANPHHRLGYGCGLRLAAHPKPRRAPSRGLVQRHLSSKMRPLARGFYADVPVGAVGRAIE